MVGARLPLDLVRELELIEGVEQCDRSTTVRRLLSKAIVQWKLEHYAGLYGEGKLTLARAAREAGVSLWEMMEHTRARKVAVQYGIEDLRQDVGTIGRGLSGSVTGGYGTGVRCQGSPVRCSQPSSSAASSRTRAGLSAAALRSW